MLILLRLQDENYDRHRSIQRNIGDYITEFLGQSSLGIILKKINFFVLRTKNNQEEEKFQQTENNRDF